jgi:DegV family protein with EDD domain
MQRRREEMKIITDTSALYSLQEGKEFGIEVIPACTLVDGVVYRDYEDISSEEFLKLIEQGVVPTSSQPAIGDVIDIFESTQEDILYLTIGDGLSGTYQSAMGARNSVEPNEHIHIIDTQTLGGAQRYLVQKAMLLMKEGLGIEEIITQVKESIVTSVSFVIPSDFNYLKRSGRLTSIAATICGVIKIIPVLTQTEDMKRIKPFVVKRSYRKAVDAVIERLKEMRVNRDYIISIGHAGVLQVAEAVMNQIRNHFSDTTIEIFQLSPSMITHGGPGCITIQAICR